MLKDLGVCEEAYTCIGGWLQQHGFDEIDYDQAIDTLLLNQEYCEKWLMENDHSKEHGDFNGWLTWFIKLRDRPEAIMYFGDHIEENLYMTPDGFLHESIAAAKDYIKRLYQEIRDDHASKRIINGIKIDADGHETWEKIDFSSTDLSQYQEFVWHDSNTGLNHRTSSPTVAIIYDSEQRKILELIDETEQMVIIKRKITDKDNKYSVWVDVK